MSPDLPQALRAAIARELEGAARGGLAERAARTSEAYRAGKPSSGVIRHADDALAYALVRAPATYAACMAAMGAVEAAAPEFAPRTMLDAGAGTGGGSWAARETWASLEQLTLLDASQPFLELAARLGGEGLAGEGLGGAEYRRGDLTSGGPWPVADLVLASYALAEIAPERQGAMVRSLWDACAGVLMLVEPGTPAGYGRIIAGRAALIAAGAQVLAPCPHAAPCPLSPPDWCHFVQRLPRSRDHRLLKGADVPYEDEKFSYVAVARPGVATARRGARVLAPPKTGKPGIALKLCTPGGACEARFVGRRDKAAYAVARRVGWGDVV